MIKAKILRVTQGPSDDGQFQSHGSTLYATAWMCDVEYENGAQENAKVIVNGKSREGGYAKKFIQAGCFVVAKDRTEYKGVIQLKVDGNATKEANGETAFNQNAGGNAPSGGGLPPPGATTSHSAAPSGVKATQSAAYTLVELVALFSRCHDAAIYVMGDGISDEALQAGTATLFIKASNIGIKVPKEKAAQAPALPQAPPPPPPAARPAPPPTVNNQRMQETLDNTPPPPPDHGYTDEELEDMPF